MSHRTVAPTAPSGRLPADVSPTAYLPLPDLDDLTIEQAAGRACVWGGQPITITRSTDLGEQTTGGRHWFPRACGICYLQRVADLFFAHERDCPLCHDDDRHTERDTSRALNWLVRRGYLTGGCR
ncbi:hypothetical protein [Streptomyces sp. LaPpAH-108]|uniref:hypothetical protein n=1 Tax=Streptomyces sp. LaPpAH-108 TaxID=1155714 RepID=UPI00037F6DB5|nr:hypothetical protein [Streptomyces sp. LaPpAH-108]